jgi:hypothetical protein
MNESKFSGFDDAKLIVEFNYTFGKGKCFLKNNLYLKF